MVFLPTLPERSTLERISIGLALGVATIGFSTIAGWFLQSGLVLLPLWDIAVLKFNAAVGFALLGSILLALEFGHRRAAMLALIPAGIAALTLLEYGFAVDLRIDELVVRDLWLNQTQFAGRMAPTLAISLLLASLVLFWRATRRLERARIFGEAIAGSILAAAGISTLLGYIAELPAVYHWGTSTAMAPTSAIALLLLGLAFLTLAWRESTEERGEAPSWSAIPALIGCCTLTIILWVGLRDREMDYVHRTTKSQIDALALTIASQLDHQTNTIERLARRLGDETEDSLAGWVEDARITHAEAREFGCASIAFVDANGVTQVVVPVEGNEHARGMNHFADQQQLDNGEISYPRRIAIEQVQRTKSPVISGTTVFPVPPNGVLRRGAVIYAPVIRRDAIVGYVAAEYAYRPFFRTLTSRQQLNTDYHVVISVGGDSVFESIAPVSGLNRRLTLDPSVTIAQRRIRLSLTPTDEVLAKDRRFLPEFALIAGLGITILLGLSVHLARSARAGQRAAELSNRKLFAENEERRRIEARLKISDERLRLALDSTQIGIFEWSVAASHVYYSPGMWAMLGYDHARMPSTVEAWQSLIHPDDIELYRRRTESQLSGATSFIEPEYRVRARNGDWRWVYTRAKSVAVNPDGTPTRIVGTVQDITARREAEIALRESQAEARKLSLVAAKTDNPVLIGSPDGRIEWANEAFCRVMEYELDEVIGKNPAHFMIGPETSPRTVARIRAAMARGQGISTDVVNYSKSGRKFHLHIEVQPVHGASGELENFIAVETDITSRVETEQQLRRAKADADDASRAKSEFLASMSHEIRTPMNGVIGMTSLLMETNLTAEQRDFVNTIRTSGEALLTIINDILDFSKIESGKMELERAPFELALCLEDTLDLFALQASAKQIELGYTIAPDVPSWVIGDVTRLRQVLVNLVNNAVKFTPAGSISVEVRRVSRGPTPVGFAADAEDPQRAVLEFTVRDTGIGIPPERADRLFQAFSQIDSSTTRKYGGTGLGLAICQQLCELMGGGIRVESKVGAGSAFLFTIQAELATGASGSGLGVLPLPVRLGTVLCVEDDPTTQARLRSSFEKWGVGSLVVVPDATSALHAAAGMSEPPALLVIDTGPLAGPSPVEQLAGIRCPRLLLYPFGQTPPGSDASSLPQASTSKPIRTLALLEAINGLFRPVTPDPNTTPKPPDRPIGEEIPLEVLLAEDNAVNQKVALRFLERLGYRADAVANGLEVLAAVQNRHYDLVLMDLQMPEMDGIEATRQIRVRLPASRQPKVIALTANAMQGDRELCVTAGMDDHITKPVKMHEIAAAIRRHFGKPDPSQPVGSQLIG